MFKLCNILKKYGLDLTAHVTADGEHVRFSWKKDLYPGGWTFSFWELENLSHEAIEDKLIRAVEDWAELVAKLEGSEPAWW